MTNKHSINGFIPHRSGGQLGDDHGTTSPQQAPIGLIRPEISRQEMKSTKLQRSDLGIARTDINESLEGIDITDTSVKGKKGRKNKVPKPPKSRKRRIIKWIIIVLFIVGLAVGGWVIYKGLNATKSIFKGNIIDIIQNQPLKQDANGRSNILILGTSEDDPGHDAAYLTDSMMVMSIDQKNKVVDMFSIPRDLYVEYGVACNSGYRGKINAYFNCANEDWTSDAAEEDRMTKTRAFVGEIFGMEIQYGVHVNNTVIKEAVDAVGGVDVDIQGSGGAPGILDRNFDWRCGYQCYLVKYDNGVHHLDGEHALYLAMARGDVAPTYGLGNSNFDREKNQQKIILALKEKATSTGTFADISKVTGLIDALGKNLRTNFETKEIRTLMELGSDVKIDQIKTISLFDGDAAVVTSDRIDGASVVIPVAGAYNYDQIRAYLKEKLSTNPVTRDEASVAVFNGSGVAGVGQREADALTAEGFMISSTENAPEGTYGTVDIYQIGEGKSVTRSKLESLFSTKVKTIPVPFEVAEGTNFVVIFGKDRSASN
jgi:LCP family protein required for cell wall assembly